MNKEDMWKLDRKIEKIEQLLDRQHILRWVTWQTVKALRLATCARKILNKYKDYE